MDEVIEMLQEGGFTRNEARTYVCLLQKGEAQTGVLCMELSIPSSNIYRILESLLKKGVISYKTINNIKIFVPNNPETLNVLYLQKQEALESYRKKIQSAISLLKKIPSKTGRLSDYKYFEGIAAIKSMWLELLGMIHPTKEVCIITSDVDGFKQLNAFYMEEYHKLREKKKVKQRMIMPIEAEEYAKERKRLGFTEVRHLPFNNLAEFLVYDDYLVVQSTSDKLPTAFLIHNPAFAHTFKVYFDFMWAKAKK